MNSPASQNNRNPLEPIQEKIFEGLKLPARIIDRGLDALATPPDHKPGAGERARDLAIALMPFLSGTKTYADARAKYEYALRESPENRDAIITDARRKCLLACASIGLDAAAFGAGKLLAAESRIAARIITALGAGRKAVAFTKKHEKALEPMIDRALSFPVFRNAMDLMLGAFQCEEAQQKAA